MTKKVRPQSRSLHKTLPLWTVSAMLLTQACSPAEQEENNSLVQTAAQNAAALRSDPLLRTAVQSSSDHLMGLRNSLGLDVNSDFRPRSAVADELGAKHIRYDQMYRGVRVWGGDVIVEVGANGTPKTTTNTLKPGITLATIPSLTQAQVLEIAHNDLRPTGPYAHARTAELVVYPQIIDQAATPWPITSIPSWKTARRRLDTPTTSSARTRARS
jgi:Zn-dependent metalloprotease